MRWNCVEIYVRCCSSDQSLVNKTNHAVMVFLENNMEGNCSVRHIEFPFSESTPFFSWFLAIAVAGNLGSGNRVVRQKQKARELQIMPPIYYSTSTYFHGELMIMSNVFAYLTLRPVLQAET